MLLSQKAYTRSPYYFNEHGILKANSHLVIISSKEHAILKSASGGASSV
jgi:hypothetical protein